MREHPVHVLLHGVEVTLGVLVPRQEQPVLDVRRVEQHPRSRPVHGDQGVHRGPRGLAAEVGPDLVDDGRPVCGHGAHGEAGGGAGRVEEPVEARAQLGFRP